MEKTAKDKDIGFCALLNVLSWGFLACGIIAGGLVLSAYAVTDTPYGREANLYGIFASIGIILCGVFLYTVLNGIQRILWRMIGLESDNDTDASDMNQ
jgi:hypothetical protein